MARSLLNKLNTPNALRQALVFFTMLLFPSAAWAGDPIISTFTGYDATTSTITFGSGSTGEWSLYGDVTGVLGSYNNNTDKGLQITNSEGSYQSSFKLISNFTVSGTIANNETLCTITMGHSDSSIPNGSISIKYDPSNSQYTQEISTLQNSLTNGENTFKPMGGNGLTFENNHLIIEFNYLNPGSGAFYISSIQLSSELTKTITNYDIKICGTQVNSENASKVQGDYLSGGIKFTPASSSNNNTNTLTLNDATIDGYIEYKSSAPLIIEFSGVNKVGVQNPGYITSDVTTTLTLKKKGEDSSSLSFSNPSSGLNYSSIHHFSNVEVLEGVYMQSSEYCRYVNNDFQDLYEGLVKYLTFTTTPTYPIWIGETQVTDDNKDHILGSSNATVTFTPASTSEDPSILTLNGANFNETKIVNGLQNLTIHLKGENLIKGASETYPLSTAISSIVSTATLSFTSDVNAVNNPTGKLFFQYVTTPINGFNSDIVYNNGLEWGTIYDNSNNSYTGVGEVNYGLLIGNIQVTSANYSPIKDGDGNSIGASYNKTNNTLTLNGATINGRIEWNNGTNDLRICLSGKNSIICNKGEESPVSVFKSENTCTLFVEKVSDAGSATLKYASYGTSGEKVINASSYLENFIFSANSTDFNQAPFTIMDGEIKYNYFTLKENIFPLTIAGIQVHNIEGEPGYKTDILGDGKVSFDGTSTLTLNNAEINVTGNGIETTEDLTIKLAGTNSITTTSGFPLYGILPQAGSSNRVVTFTSGSNPSGILTLSSSGNLTEHVTVTSTDYNLESINWNTDKNAVIAKGFTGLTIAGTLITSEYLDENGVISGVSGITPGTVKFTPAVNSTPATLTLNGAALTAPIIIGLSELTIDIQGTNSITTEEKCIQKMENTTPAVTFTSTSDVVGSLTLKGAAGVNNLGEYGIGSFSISDKLALVLKKDGYIYSNTYWFTDGSTKEAILSPSYGVTVGGMQICQDNAANVIGEGIGNGKQGGMVSFTPAVDGTPATLTLNSATISGTIKSSLNDLIIKIAGSSNTLTAILYEGSSNGTLLFQNAPSSSSNVNKLTLQNSTGAVFSGFSTVTLDGLFFSTPNYPSVTTSTDWTSSIIEAIITNEYGITIGGVDVTTTNKDDVLNDEGTVKFTPADNTASPATPATLTLNGAVISGTISWTNSAPLTIAINGTNSITTTGAYAIEGNNQDNTTLTIAKVSETGKCKLILSGSTGGSISGFKNSSDTYAGSGLVYYEDQEEYTATILSTLSGSGTSTDPYLIETPEDLKDFSFFVNKQIITNKYIKIANNIDCKDLEGFESIGSSYPFMGTLSGYGNTISNLTINSGLGFFGHISGGIVNDLNFYKLSVKGNSYATGGIASELSAGGQIDNCTLTECTIACLDNQYSPEVGGIVARLSDSGSKISNCVVYNSTINASTTYTGGSGPIGYAGGIVASYSSGIITNCHVKNGSKIINVNADGSSTLKTGALVGNVSSDATTSITSNFYYYDVTVETQLGSSAKETKSGYTPRGTNDNTEDPTGAVLYTKDVIIPISTDAGHVSIGSDYYYQVTSDDTNATYSVAPDVEVVISVENADVEGSFTLDSETKTIELKPKEGSTGLYTFDMPNADVTFTVQEAAAVHFSEEGQIYTSYYNATKDVAVPMGMTAYIVTGVSEDGTEVIVSPVSYIKKGVAVLIEKDKTTEVSETTDFSGSKLIYAENEVPVTTESKLYVLYQNQFVKVTSGTQIPTGKNYLDLSTSTNAGTRGFYNIGGANDGTSALREVKSEGVKSEKRTDDKWFDLQGRRLSAKPTKSGLYLHNGAKVVVK